MLCVCVCVQDLAGLRMNMLNQNTIKVFKSMSGIYQDHYPVSGPQSGSTPLPPPLLPSLPHLPPAYGIIHPSCLDVLMFSLAIHSVLPSSVLYLM